MAGQSRVSGHIRVEERRSARVWIASFTRQDGSKSRKTLDRAWVKDSGRRTPRGAVVWRSANGTKPGDDDLTPREAAEALAALLGGEKARGVVSLAGAA